MKKTKIYVPEVKLPALFKRSANSSWAMKFMDKATGKRVVRTLPFAESQIDPETGKKVPCNKAIKYAEGIMLDNLHKATGYLEKTKSRSASCKVAEICDAYLADPYRKCQEHVAKDNNSALFLILKETGYGSREKSGKCSASILTEALMEKFSKNRLAKYKRGSDEYEAASRTINSVYTHAASLFSADQFKHKAYKDLELPPNISEFRSVTLLPVSDPEYTYIGADEMAEVIRTSEDKRITHPDVFCAFLLASTCGLRKNEIVHAHRGWLSFKHGKTTHPIRPNTNIESLLQTDGAWFITVPDRESFKKIVFVSKGKRSREIPIHPGVVKELFRLNGLGYDPEYLVPTTSKTRRIKWLWKDFSHWFKMELGIKREKSAHECRKAYGAQVASSFGIYHACKYLGHASVKTTEKYYADLVDDRPLPTVEIPKGVRDGTIPVITEESPSTRSELSK